MTLVEAMVAIVVLGIVFVAAFSTVAQQVKTVETARDYTRIAQILQSEIEYLRTQTWDSLNETSGWEAITVSSDFTDLYGNRYTAYRKITNLASDKKELGVKVTWLDGKGILNDKRTVTWYTKEGMNDYYYRSF